MAADLMRARYELLEENKGAIEMAWKLLQLQFTELLQESKPRIDVAWQNGLIATLTNAEFDRTERERGGPVPIVKLVEGSSTQKPIWVSWMEAWREGSKRNKF